MENDQITDHIYTKADTNAIFKRVAFLLVLASIMSAIIVMARYPTFRKTPSSRSEERITKFVSYDDAVAYIQESQQIAALRGGSASDSRVGIALEASPTQAAIPSRVSTTNVQVVGIDEPDIVKTNGQQIFFSSDQFFYPLLTSQPTDLILPEGRLIPPIEQETKTQVINAFPVDSLGISSTIPQKGQLLLSEDTLIVFTSDAIYGYDVTNPQNPQEKWKLELENSFVSTSRLLEDKLYIITQTAINPGNPCPVPLLKAALQSLTIACTDIYHPRSIVPVDSTYSILEINPSTGAVGNKLSFLGSTSQSIVYISTDNLYLTYTKQNDLAKLYYQFFTEDGANLLPTSLVQKIQVLETYAISPQSKLNEVQLILSQYQLSLSKDDQLKFQQNLENSMSSFTSRHVREIEETTIIKIPLGTLTLGPTGTVPGRPLNQFSLDEYQGNMRIATTASGGWFGSTQSISDLYVLNENLDVTGTVQNMGRGERIYSARFIEDKGYVVTFKQIDPFYVLDLRDPNNPSLRGELKIPGYSSYLHPIDKDTIIGVGKEENYVKLSLFDVRSPELPQEIAKFNTTEFWSEALDDHHAFLLDPEHQIFFIPGSQGGYIFSFEGNTLTLKHAINSPGVKRALFIDNFLYVIGVNKLTVLDESTWTTVKELDW